MNDNNKSHISSAESKKSMESLISDLNNLDNDAKSLFKVKKVIKSKSAKNVVKYKGIDLGQEFKQNKKCSERFDSLNIKKSVIFKKDLVDYVDIERISIVEESTKVICGYSCTCLIF